MRKLLIQLRLMPQRHARRDAGSVQVAFIGKCSLLTPTRAIWLSTDHQDAGLTSQSEPITFVTALAFVDVMPVTTVVLGCPGCPPTLFTTSTLFSFTPVTHVSAEAEANSAVLRLMRLTANRR